jgi:hypothetical protein
VTAAAAAAAEKECDRSNIRNMQQRPCEECGVAGTVTKEGKGKVVGWAGLVLSGFLLQGLVPLFFLLLLLRC